MYRVPATYKKANVAPHCNGEIAAVWHCEQGRLRSRGNFDRWWFFSCGRVDGCGVWL